MVQPVYYWNPVISPSGTTIYSGRLFPEWLENFFIGGLSSKAVRPATLASGKWEVQTGRFTCSRIPKNGSLLAPCGHMTVVGSCVLTITTVISLLLTDLCAFY